MLEGNADAGAGDHSVKTRADPTQHEGIAGGGQGLAEMRERKMEGRGGPSPQVSRTRW